MNKPPFILVDGSSYLYRAFHALPPLMNSKGQPTGAIYGVINMLKKLITAYHPTHIAVIFDTKGKTFRDEMYAEYKAHRPVMPDDLQLQIEPLHAVIRAMGLPLLLIEGVEADDVIGTLAKQAADLKWDTLISTGDKDFAQLVNQHITLINTMSDQKLDREGVIKKFGLPPERIIDYLALVGDTSDNVPGVPNVGPKTAVKWLTEYDSLKNLVKNADKITGKVGDNLRGNLEQLELSEKLVTIKVDVELPVTPETLKPQAPNQEELAHWFKELEFKSWLHDLTKSSDSNGTAPEVSAAKTKDKKNHYEIILDEENLDDWIKKLEKASIYAVDTETNSLDYMQAQVVGISFSIASHEGIYIPFGHDYLGAPTQLSRELVLKKLKPLLENSHKNKIGHHIKFDKNVLANYGIELNGIAFDTMLESYVLDSTGSRHDMDTLAMKYLGHRTITFEEIAGKGVKQLTFNQIPLETAGPYAAEDADVTFQLHQTLWPRIENNKGMTHILLDLEIPLIPVLSRIERKGVLIDVKKLHKQSEEITKRLAELETEAHKLAGMEFNLSSPKQLQQILYEKNQLPVLEKTPTGQPSTAESVLQELAMNYPIAKVILEHRGLSKLKSTYTDRLPEQMDHKTGRVHTSYHQAAVATGRLSSTDPNLQNIPVRTEEGRRIRQAFIAPPGYKIVAADYSQIELRIMADISNDENLLNAFAHGWDIHQATAAEVLGIPIEEVTSEQRRSAKAINFGLIYGMSSFGLAKQLGVERHAAQQYIDLYFARYPRVREYMENTRKKAHQDGYVETLLGRRLTLPEINARNIQRQKAAERAAINAPLQGTAADIIKLAMIQADKELREKRLNASMIMQVHDELVFEVAENILDSTVEIIQNSMIHAIKLKVPLVVAVGIGHNWDEAH